jgi:hypothetical protein
MLSKRSRLLLLILLPLMAGSALAHETAQSQDVVVQTR